MVKDNKMNIESGMSIVAILAHPDDVKSVTGVALRALANHSAFSLILVRSFNIDPVLGGSTTPGALWLGAIAGILASLTVGIIPAWQGARMLPARALRHE